MNYLDVIKSTQKVSSSQVRSTKRAERNRSISIVFKELGQTKLAKKIAKKIEGSIEL